MTEKDFIDFRKSLIVFNNCQTNCDKCNTFYNCKDCIFFMHSLKDDYVPENLLVVLQYFEIDTEQFKGILFSLSKHRNTLPNPGCIKYIFQGSLEALPSILFWRRWVDDTKYNIKSFNIKTNLHLPTS